MYQDESWCADRPRPWPHCVRWGPNSPSPRRGTHPNFRPIFLVAKWLDELRCHLDVGPGHIVRDRQLAPPPKKRTQPPIFGHVYCGQTAGWMKMPLGTEVDLCPGHIVLDGDPAPPSKGAEKPPLFGQCLLWPLSPISATAELFFCMSAHLFL